MSLRRGPASSPPPRSNRGRVERLLTFSRGELALARLATLAVGVRPGEARPGDKRDRGNGPGEGEGEDERDGNELLMEAEEALRDAEAVPTERLRALQSQIYIVLERGLVNSRLERALRSAAARLQDVELARDPSATQMDYDAERRRRSQTTARVVRATRSRVA